MLPLLLSKTQETARPATIVTLAILAFTLAARVVVADPLRISEDEAKRAAVAKASPIMPPIAKQAHLSGRVVVDLNVGEDGSVEKVNVVSGNPILGGAAIKAGKNWMFNPFKGPDGKPAKAVVRVSFDF